jgi:catechol 2,3-dioxygenase-like lactoylglutathione lyase family enzyme
MIRGGLVTLFVSDVEVSMRFYIETLGMKLVHSEDGFAIIDAGEGFSIGLHRRGKRDKQRGDSAPKVGLYPKLPIREAMAILENRGVTFDVLEDDKVVIANFEDPDHNVLYLRQTK